MLHDKITLLRKQKGWSQEELADHMGVSRQAVSKWESGQAQPDIDKIILFSELFGVSTDFLLKEEGGAPSTQSGNEKSDMVDAKKRCVSQSEAADYILRRKKASLKLALASYLCVLSPICLLLLIGFTQREPAPLLPPSIGVLIGIAALLFLVAIAVALFVVCALDVQSFAYLDNEPFSLSTDAKGMVEKEKAAYKKAYTRLLLSGICLCILSPISLLCGAFSDNSFLLMLLLCVTIAIVGAGVFLFVVACTREGSFGRLLQEGEFSRGNKEKERRIELISSVYWLLVTAGYLTWSFLSMQWGKTWIVWPIAGIVFAAVTTFLDFFIKKKEEHD